MNPYELIAKLHPTAKKRVILILLAFIIAAGISFSGLTGGYSLILSGLFFFPLILLACWFPAYSYPFLILMAVFYGFALKNYFFQSDFISIASVILGAVIFALAGFLISLLSSGLRKSESLLNNILYSLPDASFALDNKGAVISWNKTAEKLTGVKMADVIGKNDYEAGLAVYGERRRVLADFIVRGEDGLEEMYPNLSREDEMLSADMRIPHFRGESGAYIHFDAIALKDSAGNIIGGIESFHDITDRIITESALNNTTKKLNTISGIIRTDLSNKLAVLYGYLRIGTVKFNDPDVISFIQDLKKAADGIERQLGISRGFRAIGTKPPAWISVQESAVKASEKVNLKMIAFRPWTERLEIFADPHLPTALYHLLDNSANLAGNVSKIVLTYKLIDEGCLLIYEDNGPGIPDIDKEGLFNRDIDNSYGRGLFLTLDILSITGIKIKETGIFGKGARFEILIPSEGYRIK